MLREFWLIRRNLKGYSVKNNVFQIEDRYTTSSLKEAEEEFMFRNTLNSKHAYVITESRKFVFKK